MLLIVPYKKNLTRKIHNKILYKEKEKEKRKHMEVIMKNNPFFILL